MPGTDLIISCSANRKEDWSSGMGRAQFFDKEVAKMPKRLRFAGLLNRAVCMEKMNVLDKVSQ